MNEGLECYAWTWIVEGVINYQALSVRPILEESNCVSNCGLTEKRKRRRKRRRCTYVITHWRKGHVRKQRRENGV